MQRIQSVLIALFMTSLLASMAGMEIFGWAIVATAIASLLCSPIYRRELKQPFFLIIYALLIWVALGIFFNREYIDAPWMVLCRMRWVAPFLAVTLVLPDVYEEKMARKLLIFLTVIAGLVAAYSITQYWTGQDWLRGAASPLLIVEETRHSEALRYRPYGLFKMTLTYACSYAMFAAYPFCISFYYLNRDRKMFWFLQIASWIIICSVLLTFSRGIWVGIVPVFAILLWILQRRFLLIAATICAISIAGSVAISPAIQARLASFSDMKHQSNSDRMIVWRANLEMVKDHPFFGVGYEKNGPPRILEYYERLKISKDAFASHAHNVYLNFLSGTGIVGFLLYLALVGGVFWISCKNVVALSKERSWLYYFALAGVGAQAIFLIGGLTEYNFGDSEVRYQYLTHLSFQLFIRRKIS